MTTTMLVHYPESEKWAYHRESRQIITEFWEYLLESGYDESTVGGINIYYILYDYYEIDQWKLELERRHMIEAARALVIAKDTTTNQPEIQSLVSCINGESTCYG